MSTSYAICCLFCVLYKRASINLMSYSLTILALQQPLYPFLWPHTESSI
jgi:hypothetical protein